MAMLALGAGVAITALKFAIFGLTDSAAVLSDALESIINLLAAGVMIYCLWLSNRPADRDHPYGHGKIEFLAVGFEGWLILAAGVAIASEAVRRWLAGVEPRRLDLGMGLSLVVAGLSAALAAYVWRAGRKYDNSVLLADGKHLLTDVASTVGVVIGLGLVKWTGWAWLDPLVALLMAGLILKTSWKLLWQSVDGLMDRAVPADDAVIRQVLDEEVRAGAIRGYHKVRHRHTGSFHWVDMHLQFDAGMSVRESHAVASRIENRIEQRLGPADATAHIEPYELPGEGEPPVVTVPRPQPQRGGAGQA